MLHGGEVTAKTARFLLLDPAMSPDAAPRARSGVSCRIALKRPQNIPRAHAARCWIVAALSFPCACLSELRGLDLDCRGRGPVARRLGAGAFSMDAFSRSRGDIHRLQRRARRFASAPAACFAPPFLPGTAASFRPCPRPNGRPSTPVRVCGTAIFSPAAPTGKKLLAVPRPKLTAEEQSFLDGETEQLCAMVKRLGTTQVYQDLPPHAGSSSRTKASSG